MRFIISLIVVLAISSVCLAANTATGPFMDPLEVSSIDVNDSGKIYIYFNIGAMPECGPDESVGYITRTNKNFKELYALALILNTSSGKKGRVTYFIKEDEPSTSHGKCIIRNIYVTNNS